MLKNLKNRLDNSKGFTLVELIVVIAIMVILIALLAPNVIGYISSSQKTANLSAAKSIYNAANTCVVNCKASKGKYPDQDQLRNLMNGYTADSSSTTSDEGKLVTVSTGTSSIIYYVPDKGQVACVLVGTVSADKDADTADATNKAVYDPELSGNALEDATNTKVKYQSGTTGAVQVETSKMPSGYKRVGCQNGNPWTSMS